MNVRMKCGKMGHFNFTQKTGHPKLLLKGGHVRGKKENV
jgi:hypothetical protein